MKIFAITFASHDVGSTAFRLIQYLPLLKKGGITLEIVSQKELRPHHFEAIKQSDWLFVQKCLLPLPLAFRLRRYAKKVLFDFDDAIWTRPLRPYSWLTYIRVAMRLHFWLKHADKVTCSSHFLGQYAEKYCTPYILPMAVDTNLWKPKERPDDGLINIGWAGAPNNLVHIERLDPVLKQLKSDFPNVRFHIFSGKKPHLETPFEYTPFSEEAQTSFIQKLDIGLLPLTNEEFSWGKSPIKAIQYISCGVPVIGNIWGATKDILKPDFSIAIESECEWRGALELLISSKQLRQEMGQKARQFALTHHSRDALAQQFINLLY